MRAFNDGLAYRLNERFPSLGRASGHALTRLCAGVQEAAATFGKTHSVVAACRAGFGAGKAGSGAF